MGRLPGLIQLVLTVLVFWSRMLLVPRLPTSFGSLTVPLNQRLLHGPLVICLDLLPTAPLPPIQKRDVQHTLPRGPNDQKIQSRWKFSISIEIFNLVRKFQSRRLEFPKKK